MNEDSKKKEHKKPERGERERKFKKSGDKDEEETYVEEEITGITLEEMKATKNLKSLKAGGREAEAIDMKNIQVMEGAREGMSTINSKLQGGDVYNSASQKTESTILLGFQAKEDDTQEGDRDMGKDRRGGKGRRGDRKDRADGGADRRGGKGKKSLVVTEDAFPTL